MLNKSILCRTSHRPLLTNRWANVSWASTVCYSLRNKTAQDYPQEALLIEEVKIFMIIFNTGRSTGCLPVVYQGSWLFCLLLQQWAHLGFFLARDEQRRQACFPALDIAALLVIHFQSDYVTLLASLRLTGCLCDRLITTNWQTEKKGQAAEASQGKGEQGLWDTGVGRFWHFV